MPTHWLLKAEPDERRVRGVDVSFSAETFERVRTSPWEGVRNYQARNFLRDEMKVGHRVLFYHSNTKLPGTYLCLLPVGVAALAEVCREGYPDPTAWDAEHPYFDPHTRPDEPRWYRVDVQFVRRLPHFVPLALLQHLSEGLSESEREDVAYLSDAQLASVAAMPLLHRSRLSVQPVDDAAYDAICLLGDRGGFAAWPGKWNVSGGARSRRARRRPRTRSRAARVPRRRKRRRVPCASVLRLRRRFPQHQRGARGARRVPRTATATATATRSRRRPRVRRLHRPRRVRGGALHRARVVLRADITPWDNVCGRTRCEAHRSATAESMPLEHFGGPRLGEGSNRRAPRPLSEPGVLDARRAGVSRAASDAHAARQARDRLRSERGDAGDAGDDEDRAVLSKLTGVSRSVSWGRAQAEASHRAPSSACTSGDQTPKPMRSASARTPSGSRLRPHYTNCLLYTSDAADE